VEVIKASRSRRRKIQFNSMNWLLPIITLTERKKTREEDLRCLNLDCDYAGPNCGPNSYHLCLLKETPGYAVLFGP